MKKIEYRVIRKNVKGLTLRVTPDLQVKLTAPLNFPISEIQEWVNSKSDWILNKMAIFENALEKRPPTDCRLLGEIVSPPNEISDELSLTLWYKQEAKKYLIPRLEYISSVTGLKYQKVFIRDTHSKYGSCSSLGNIGLNYRLIKAPKPIIDYVIIHELCHTIHFDHSPTFWSLVESYLPDYKESEQWLKQYGHTLF